MADPMTPKAILTKAIEKAKINGWGEDIDYWVQSPDAKALWNYEEEREIETSEVDDDGHEHIERYKEKFPAWQYHLQQMVIADDPIKYLEDNI